jgi:hypothetical protein
VRPVREEVASFRGLTHPSRHLVTLRAGRLDMSAGDRKYFDTKLDRWMAANNVKPAHLAAESGYSRQHLLRIRRGDMEPTRRCIKAITAGCRRLSAKAVRASDLFDLGD